jgi:hypothetical protein
MAALAVEKPQVTDPAPRIPFMAELTISGVVGGASGDHEPIYQVLSIGNDSYRIVLSAEAPQGFGDETVYIEVPRTVSLEDQKNARIMRPRFFTDDPDEFSGTTPFFSVAVMRGIRK